MILQFSVSNFRAFRGLQTLNFAASRADKSLPENWTEPSLPGLKNGRWVNGAAIYGANASGKSTVLLALSSLVRLVSESAKITDPKDPITLIEPFALDPSASDEPTAFALVFVAGGIRYEYRVAASYERIIHESLRSFPKGAERLWFVRNWSDELVPERKQLFSRRGRSGRKDFQAPRCPGSGRDAVLSGTLRKWRSHRPVSPVFVGYRTQLPPVARGHMRTLGASGPQAAFFFRRRLPATAPESSAAPIRCRLKANTPSPT